MYGFDGMLASPNGGFISTTSNFCRHRSYECESLLGILREQTPRQTFAIARSLRELAESLQGFFFSFVPYLFARYVRDVEDEFPLFLFLSIVEQRSSSLLALRRAQPSFEASPAIASALHQSAR